VNLFRCFPWDREVAAGARGGAVWFARMLQGDGRHDNPLLYGCLYCSTDPVSALVEQLAPFVGRPLRPGALRRYGLQLALARLELPDEARLVDLDDPEVLVAEELRPSDVATNERERTQADAAVLFRKHPDAVGLRWWSTFEAQWANVTLFDRKSRGLTVADVRELDLADETVGEAARFLGLRVERRDPPT
jgi:hypothetical protein